MLADEDLHRRATENRNYADALIFGRVTYGMMEQAAANADGSEAR